MSDNINVDVVRALVLAACEGTHSSVGGDNGHVSESDGDFETLLQTTRSTFRRHTIPSYQQISKLVKRNTAFTVK